MTDQQPVQDTPAPKPPSLKPPTVAPTALLVADNFSTRLREIAAIIGYVVLAHWGVIPGQWAAGLIALTVLPIEITRQIVKAVIAKSLSSLGIEKTGGAALALLVAGGVVKATDLITWGSVGAAGIASIAAWLT